MTERDQMAVYILASKDISKELGLNFIVLNFKDASRVVEMLKEQEPVKPTISVDTWICSKCGHTLESQELIDDKENPQVLIHEQYQYCPNCGRAVKWE